jgi:hypothetical protein
MSTSRRFHEDVLIIDYYRADGQCTINYDWGTFDGSFAKGRANGFGVQMMRRTTIIPGGIPAEENAVYRGDWKDGKREGHGRLEIPWENKIYEGGWVDGKAYGFGKSLSMSKGWAGEWEESGYKDGYRHGWGFACVSNDPSGTVWYNGGFKEGDRHGYYIKYSGGLESYTSVKHGVTHGYLTVKKDGVVKTREFFQDGYKASQPTTPIQTATLPSMVSVSDFMTALTHIPAQLLFLTGIIIMEI